MTAEPMFIDTPSAAALRSGPLWTTPEMYDPERKRPAFSVKTTAEVFFGMSAPWLRKHQRQSNFSMALGKVEPLRTPVKYHLYRLYDIERLAHTFAGHQVIDGIRLERIITMVQIVAQLHGYLPIIQPPSLKPQAEMPLGHTGFSTVMPETRASALHLMTQILHSSDGVVPNGISCLGYGDHQEGEDCRWLLRDALKALRKLEKHLQTGEDTD
jgi:hypothetical protein